MEPSQTEAYNSGQEVWGPGDVVEGTRLFWTRFTIGNMSILPDLFRHDPISEMWSRWGEGWEVKVSHESSELLRLLQDIFQRGPGRDRDGVRIWWPDTGDFQHDMNDFWDLAL